jgi:3-oxoacyl-(acyl-carrier-protein) synthase
MSIIVTGMGAVSAAGLGCQATAISLFAEPKTPQPITRLATSLTLPVFEVDFQSNGATSRTQELLNIALLEAVNSSGLTERELKSARVGVCIGTSVACQLNNIEYYSQLRAGTQPDHSPLKNFYTGNPAEVIQGKYSLSGPVFTIANACSSGTDAIGWGSELIANDICDIVIAGGADELNRVPIAGFNALGVCGNQPCSPFDANRQGLNLGEGAGVVVLESVAYAAARGLNPELAVASYGAATDAYHITAPHPDGIGLEQTIRQALTGAGISPHDIDFINAHGTGTASNDSCEGKVLGRIFGEQVKYLSTKRFTGHTLGAAGALEFIFTALMLQQGRVAASSGFKLLPDDIPFAPITQQLAGNFAYAMSTSLAFGGCNSAIIIQKVR